jgi:hypothetical protein
MIGAVQWDQVAGPPVPQLDDFQLWAGGCLGDHLYMTGRRPFIQLQWHFHYQVLNWHGVEGI